MSATAVAAEMRGGAWAGGLPTTGPGGCAELPGIAGQLLGYVQPLRDWFDQLLGDSARVDGFAVTWEQVSADLAALHPELETARTRIGELDGRMARALRERQDDLLAVSADAAEWTAATAASLRLASRLVDATRSFVCDLLARLADYADALFSFTLNPLEVADRIRDFAEAAFELVEAAGRLVNDLLEALFALASLIQKLMPLLAEGLEALREIIAQMLPGLGLAGGGLVGMILGGAAENFLQRAADVEELDPDSLGVEEFDAWVESQEVTRLTSLADLVGVNSTTDAMGGSNASVIDIKKVIGPDGQERWVVSLPSTQDWQLGADAGAMNDRDSNLALMMDNPALRTAYERAVLEAMSDAGVPAGADVVLTGFSQGGIMAANLAADGTFPYNTVGVVTNGSPVDSFDVPDHIPVYAFQHATDPVPMLDGAVVGDTSGPNVSQIVLPDPEGQHVHNAHDNKLYAESVAAWEQAYLAQHGTPPPGIDVFLGEVVDHSVFTASER